MEAFLASVDWNTLAALATALGVVIAALQIFESRKISQSCFEDSLDRQYRSLAMKIPVDVLLGGELNGDNRKEVRELIYNYLDLTNEQIFLRSQGRIRLKTWQSWSSGIEYHLSKPWFTDVWAEVQEKSPRNFTYLSELELRGFDDDPRGWENLSYSEEPADIDELPVL